MGNKIEINPTLERFEYPDLLIADWQHWAVLLRRHQVTLGSMVLIAKANVTAWPEIGQDAFIELSRVTAEIECTLRSSFHYDKINYLMLMMVDPNPHFHVIPRYARSVTFENIEFADPGWPKTPDLTAGKKLDDELAIKLLTRIKTAWTKEI